MYTTHHHSNKHHEEDDDHSPTILRTYRRVSIWCRQDKPGQTDRYRYYWIYGHDQIVYLVRPPRYIWQAITAARAIWNFPLAGDRRSSSTYPDNDSRQAYLHSMHTVRWSSALERHAYATPFHTFLQKVRKLFIRTSLTGNLQDFVLPANAH